MKTFEASGLWHLPADLSRQVAGTLRYSRKDGLRLSLIGTLSDTSDYSKWEDYPLIHGVVSNSPFGKKFTLVDCFRTRLSLGMPGLSTEEIHADWACAGYSLLDKEDLHFDGLRVSFSELANWIKTTGINTCLVDEDGNASGMDIQYRRPEAIRLSLRDKPLRIGFGFSTSESLLRDVTLRENVSLALEDIGQLSCEETNQRYVHPLQDFFTLATDRPNAVEEMVVFSNRLKVQATGTPSPFHVIYQPIHAAEEDLQLRMAHHMLFTYDDVKDSFPEVLNRWMTFSDEFAPFCSVFFGSQYHPARYVEAKFLALIQAIALYFGKARSADQRFHPALASAKQEIHGHFSEKHATWLSSMLPVEAEIGLPLNLLDTLEANRDIMGPLIQGDMEGFVGTVVATRNYCTRLEPRLRSQALREMELHWLTEKLAILVKACILDSLGISGEIAVKLFNRNRKYSHLRSMS